MILFPCVYIYFAGICVVLRQLVCFFNHVPLYYMLTLSLIFFTIFNPSRRRAQLQHMKLPFTLKRNSRLDMKQGRKPVFIFNHTTQFSLNASFILIYKRQKHRNNYRNISCYHKHFISQHNEGTMT